MVKKTTTDSSIEALFGVGDVEAGEDTSLANDVRSAAASFLSALTKKKSKRKASKPVEDDDNGDEVDVEAEAEDAARAAKKEKALLASFWNERAIARGEKKKPKAAPVVEEEEEAPAPVEGTRKKRVKPGKAERAALKKERESKTSQAALGGKKRPVKGAGKPEKKKNSGGLFAADEDMWAE
jgi:hypothetical protein